MYPLEKVISDCCCFANVRNLIKYVNCKLRKSSDKHIGKLNNCFFYLIIRFNILQYYDQTVNLSSLSRSTSEVKSGRPLLKDHRCQKLANVIERLVHFSCLLMPPHPCKLFDLWEELIKCPSLLKILRVVYQFLSKVL